MHATFPSVKMYVICGLNVISFGGTGGSKLKIHLIGYLCDDYCACHSTRLLSFHSSEVPVISVKTTHVVHLAASCSLKQTHNECTYIFTLFEL